MSKTMNDAFLAELESWPEDQKARLGAVMHCLDDKDMNFAAHKALIGLIDHCRENQIPPVTVAQQMFAFAAFALGQALGITGVERKNFESYRTVAARSTLECFYSECDKGYEAGLKSREKAKGV